MARMFATRLLMGQLCSQVGASSRRVWHAYQGRTNEGTLYRFALADTHRGDDYYQVASVSPIVDFTGRVISLLIDKDQLLAGTMTGLPIKDYLPLLDADLDCLC